MKKILLVDDDEIVRTVFTQLVTDEWEVLPAEDGQQAWEMLLAGARPALCCSDLIMPRLGGLGLLRRTREHPALKHLPFIFMTAAPDAATVQAAAEGGASAFIMKPFLHAQAKGAIAAALRQERDSRSEHYLVTRRRLQVELDELAARMRKLHEDAQDIGAGGSPADVEKLRALAQGCGELGLWRCGTLAEAAAGTSMAITERELVIREAAALIQDQLDEMASLS
jgi:CheY-like chemotaxis protein